MSTATALRSELLARRSREGIARPGHILLTQKRAALIAELRRVGLQVDEKQAELERIVAAARRALGWAAAVDGPQAVGSAAIAAQVARTTRQVNALERVVIPRLVAEQRHIAATLEQRALEDRARVSRRAAPDVVPARGGSRADQAPLQRGRWA